jgi:hypothetical protein
MPLIILGLILTIGIIVYAIIQYMNSGETDTRSVRERYPHAFPPRNKDAGKSKSPANNAGPAVRYDGSDSSDTIRHTEDGNIIFPSDNVEVEKHKRNIH